MDYADLCRGSRDRFILGSGLPQKDYVVNNE